jgi:hypothetical protein
MEAVPIQYITKGNPTSPDHQFRKPSRSFTKRRTTSQSSQGSKRTRSSSNQERGSSSSEQDDGGWASTYGETDTADEEDAPRGRSLKRTRHGKRIPGLTESPYSPDDDGLAWGGSASWTVKGEPFPVVIDDRRDGLKSGSHAHDAEKRLHSLSPSPLRKRLRST